MRLFQTEERTEYSTVIVSRIYIHGSYRIKIETATLHDRMIYVDVFVLSVPSLSPWLYVGKIKWGKFQTTEEELSNLLGDAQQLAIEFIDGD